MLHGHGVERGSDGEQKRDHSMPYPTISALYNNNNVRLPFLHPHPPRECIKQSVMQSNEAEVKCPFNDKYECNAVISEREIKAVSKQSII